MDSAAVRYSAKRAVEYKRFIDACSVLVRAARIASVSLHVHRKVHIVKYKVLCKMRQYLARGTRKKKTRIYRSSPRARSSNTKLKFYRNAFCIAYFKINPCIFILCTMKNIYRLTQALEVL